LFHIVYINLILKSNYAILFEVGRFGPTALTCFAMKHPGGGDMPAAGLIEIALPVAKGVVFGLTPRGLFPIVLPKFVE